MMFEPVSWHAVGPAFLPGKLRLLDQTLLPLEVRYVETDDLEEIYQAIKRLVVRGAPAIGCAAGLGLAAVCQHSGASSVTDFVSEASTHASYLASSRPTAVNLSWALERCLARLRRLAKNTDSVDTLKLALVEEALAILAEDRALCRTIGKRGLELFAGRMNLGILTHCNAGALATSGPGTALAPIYAAQKKGLKPKVFADETRPLLQGARLTAWELQRAGVDVTLICDSMAAQVMREGKVQMVIVGADRIAANGDVANKIGTYGVAVLAQYHGIPFYVAAPYSTIDVRLPDGSKIPIEQREASEVSCGFGRRTAPPKCNVYNPAFDVTPHQLIAGIITEKGILRPSYSVEIERLMAEKNGDNFVDGTP